MHHRWGFAALSCMSAGAIADVPRDGVLDASFGNGGIALFEAAASSPVAVDIIHDAVLQPGGKVLLVGRGRRQDGGAHAPIEPAVLRLNADGSIDETFGVDGFSVYPLVAPGDLEGGVAHAATILSDGRVLVVGSLYDELNSFTFRRCMLVFALSADGDLLTDYGPGPGPTCTDFGYPAPPPGSTNAVYDWLGLATSVEGGKAYVSGVLTANAPGHSVIARLDADGRFDAGFADMGRRFLNGSAWVDLYANPGLRVLPDGGLYASAQSAMRVGVLRLDAQGQPVAGFGEQGFGGLPITSGFSVSWALDLDSRGGPAVVALSRDFVPSWNVRCNFCVLRFTSTGSAESEFNGLGVQPGAPGSVELLLPGGPLGAESSELSMAVREGDEVLIAGAIPALVDSTAYTAVTLVSLARDGSYTARFGDLATPGRRLVSPQIFNLAHARAFDMATIPGRRALVVGNYWSKGLGGPKGIFALQVQDDALLASSFEAP